MMPRFVIRRMLVALDLSAPARSALPAALRLAARLHADAEGLFVEDARLIAVCSGAGLPYRHVSSVTGLPETLDTGAMEAGLRAQSAMLSRHVSATAAALRYKCGLRTVRGGVAETLVAETDVDDLLVLSRRPGHVGAVLAATVRRIASPLLILPPGETPGQGRIIVLADDAGFLERALAAADRFRNGSARAIEVVLAPGITTIEAGKLAASAGIQVRITAGPGLTDLAEGIPSDTGLVIISPDNAGITGMRLLPFLEKVSKPILLMK